MELKEILAISGQPGSLQIRRTVVARRDRGVAVRRQTHECGGQRPRQRLTEISMFTEGEDIALARVFTNIYEQTGGQRAISHKEAPKRSRPLSPRHCPTTTASACTSPT